MDGTLVAAPVATVARAAGAAFERWFGQSKVVDDAGCPAVLFHATSADLTQFDRSAAPAGFHFGPSEQANMRAIGPGKRLLAVHLAIENPLRRRDRGGGWQEAIRAAEASGHDGIVYLNRYEGIPLEAFQRAAAQLARERGGAADIGRLDALSDRDFKRLVPEARDSWIAFRPEQVKSALGNRGGYNRRSPDLLMRMADDGALGAAARERALAAWFGRSRVVDGQGRPLRVYHGTAGDFSSFDLSKASSASMHATAYLGHYFSASPEIASSFVPERWDMTVWPHKREPKPGGNVMPVYLAIARPFEMPLAEFRKLMPTGHSKSGVVQALRLRQQLERQGYDGIHIPGDPALADGLADEWSADTWVAFRPEQVKSAIGNGGQFDAQLADIRQSTPDGWPAFSAPPPAQRERVRASEVVR